jgi:hypothetical protein
MRAVLLALLAGSEDLGNHDGPPVVVGNQVAAAPTRIVGSDLETGRAVFEFACPSPRSSARCSW